jgi:hypothetical protein
LVGDQCMVFLEFTFPCLRFVAQFLQFKELKGF